MKAKKLLSMLLAGTMIVAMLTGCGGKGYNGESQESQESESESEDTLSGTVKVSVATRAGSQEAWEAVAEAYEKLHSNVDIVIDLKASDGYAEWIANLNYVDNPDVDIAEFMAGNFDHTRLLSFTDYLDEKSPYSDGTWGEQFESAALKPSTVTGEMVEFAGFSTQVMWVYNVDIFEKVGVEVPTTWDEFVTVCEKLAAAGYQPITTSYEFLGGWLNQIYMDQTTRHVVQDIVAQEGDYCYDPDKDANWVFDPTDPWNDISDNVNHNIVRALAAVKDGKLNMSTEGGKTVWTNFAKIFPKYAGGEAFFAVEQEGLSDCFYKGEAAMTLQGGWALIDFQRTLNEVKENGVFKNADGTTSEAVGFTLGTFNMPTMEGAGIEAPVRTIETSTSGFCVLNKDQKQNDLVMDFLMYYTSKEGMTIYSEAYLAAGGSFDGPILVKGVEFPEEYASLFEGLTMIGNVANGYTHYFVEGVPGITESIREFDNYAYDFLNGRISVEDFLEKADENVIEYMPLLQQALNISDEDIENPASAPLGY